MVLTMNKALAKLVVQSRGIPTAPFAVIESTADLATVDLAFPVFVSGGHLSSDGGTLLLREVDGLLGLSWRLSHCFSDERDPRWVQHQLPPP